MKYKILLTLTLFTSIGSIHSVSRATLNQITASYTGGTSPAKLQTLCRQLKGQDLAELADTSQAENFALHYKTPLVDACSAAVAGTPAIHGTPGTVGSLETVTAAENAYKAAKGTLGEDAAAEKFFKDTIKYVEDGGPTSVLDATFNQAYTNVMAQHTAATTTANAASTSVATLNTIIGKFNDPAPAHPYSPSSFATALDRSVIRWAGTLGTVLDGTTTWSNFSTAINTRLAAGMTPAAASWKDAQFDDLNTAFTNADGIMGATDAYRITGFGYATPDGTSPADLLTTQVRNAITQAYTNGNDHGVAHAGPGGGGGPTPAQNDILTDAANLRTYLATTPMPAHWTGFVNDASQPLVDEVTQLVTKVYENGEAAGVASVPAPPVAPVAGTPANVQEDITASIADLKKAVEGHNAQITALNLPAIEAFCTTAAGPGAGGALSILGNTSNTAIAQAAALKKIAPVINILFLNLHESATHLNALQHKLNTTATDAGLAPALGGDFVAIQNIHGAGGTGSQPTITASTGNNVLVATPLADGSPGHAASCDAQITAYALPA